MALLGPHEWTCKKTSCAPWLTLIKGIPTRKGSRKMRALMKIFPTRKSPLCQWINVNPTYYKNPKTLTNQGMHNFPSSDTLELWRKFSNLTFGGSLPNNDTSTLLRSSFSVLCKCYLEHVRTVWLIDDFWHHQLVPSMGNRWLVSHTIASQTKSCMVLTCLMATTNNVQGDEPRITTLKRQVQTLAAVVERLTNQNHDLEE